jgi:hypothetical protein
VWGAFACVRVLISDASFGFSFLYSHIWLTTVRWCGRREAAGWCGIHYNSSPHSLSLFLLPLYLDSRQIRPSKKSPFAFASLSAALCKFLLSLVFFFCGRPFFFFFYRLISSSWVIISPPLLLLLLVVVIHGGMMAVILPPSRMALWNQISFSLPPTTR